MKFAQLTLATLSLILGSAPSFASPSMPVYRGIECEFKVLVTDRAQLDTLPEGRSQPLEIQYTRRQDFAINPQLDPRMPTLELNDNLKGAQNIRILATLNPENYGAIVILSSQSQNSQGQAMGWEKLSYGVVTRAGVKSYNATVNCQLK